MTPQEFRAHPELAKWMREMMETTNFQLALAAMRSIDPVKRVASPDVTPHGAHILLGEQTGWAQYESQFLALATRLPIPQTIPEPDYREEQEVQPEET